MEINLNTLVHNLNYYRSELKPTTKLMAMVKAMSYGSGKFWDCQYPSVSSCRFAVAYTDEGVELREAASPFDHGDEPEVQSFEAMILLSPRTGDV